MQGRANRKRVWVPRAAHYERASVGAEAEHPYFLRTEERSDFVGDGAEDVGWGNFLRDEGRDALKRSLLALAAFSLGDVAPDGVDHLPAGHRRRCPLDPLVRAVLAQHSVLEGANRHTV